MPHFSFFPRPGFRQNVRGMHALQVFNSVGVKNVLRSGCLGRLLSLGELVDGGSRGERPLENPWRMRAQLASQHRGRHRGERVWSEEVERFSSESLAASNQRSAVVSLLTA